MTVATPAPTYFKGYGERVERFVSTHIRQTKGRWAGERLGFEPWQRELVDELYLVDGEGRNVYREALIGVPRKNGKSTLMSAIALYGLMAQGEHGAEVYVAAASKDQARIVFDQAREFVETSPELRRWLRPQRSQILCPSTNGVFRVLSSDAPLQHGLNPSLVVIDELHAHKDPELYYALTTGQLARLDPLVVSITTAGYDRETICWQVYQHGIALEKKGVDAMRKARFFSKWYTADPSKSVDDEKEWMKANPASWITVEDLRIERERLPEYIFRRLHLNQWTDAEDAWVSPQDWDACAATAKRPLIFDPKLPTFLGVDIGLKRDATAFVWCQFHGDDLHVHHKIMVPEPGHALSASENRAMLLELAGTIPALREVPYDPWSFRESAEMLEDRGLPMVEYDQGNVRMAPASERIYELIKERRLVHDGDDIFRAQVLATVVAQTERGWRISKKKSRERIDAAVAMTIAADRAILTRNEKPPRRGVTFL
jgi:phage terminase large subunit-like protein